MEVDYLNTYSEDLMKTRIISISRTLEKTRLTLLG
jgi:hypothetical protein